MKKLLNLMVLCIAFSVTQVAFAQASFDRQIADVTLLQVKEVKSDLKVSEAQRAKMNKHAEEFNIVGKQIRQKYEKSNQKPSQADLDRFSRAQTNLREKVLNELSSVQLTRLREITLQEAGLPALSDPTVGSKVGLSSTQSAKVRSILKSGAEKSAKLMKALEAKLAKEFKDKKPKNEAENKKLKAQFDARFTQELNKIKAPLQKIEQETRKGIVATLSVLQRQNWDKLLGKPLKMSK